MVIFPDLAQDRVLLGALSTRMPGWHIFYLTATSLRSAVALTKLGAVIVPENMSLRGLERYFRCRQETSVPAALISPWPAILVLSGPPGFGKFEVGVLLHHTISWKTTFHSLLLLA